LSENEAEMARQMRSLTLIAAVLFAAPVMTFGKMDLQPRRLLRQGGLKTLGRTVADDADFDRDYWRQGKPRFDHCGAIALPYRKSRPIRLELRTVGKQSTTTKKGK